IGDGKTGFQASIRTLKAQQADHESAARAAKSEGDALYLPVFNLDMKNPHTKTELVHEEPSVLMARMREHEKEVVRLLDEIEALVGGATA
ncbi:MAG: hypothetical protein RL260_3059, partial [Pseudomonadota bacterium]